MKNNTSKKSQKEPYISEEIVFKSYDDNKLVGFEVTICDGVETGKMCLITGLPDHGEIENIETLERIIECLKMAKKKWEELL